MVIQVRDEHAFSETGAGESVAQVVERGVDGQPGRSYSRLPDVAVVVVAP